MHKINPQHHSSLMYCGRTGGDTLEDTWVTVFGFPPAAASYILTQFTQLGTITEHHNPGLGNWMHLKYMVRCACYCVLSLHLVFNLCVFTFENLS